MEVVAPATGSAVDVLVRGGTVEVHHASDHAPLPPLDLTVVAPAQGQGYARDREGLLPPTR